MTSLNATRIAKEFPNKKWNLSTKEGVNHLQILKIFRMLSETNGMMSHDVDDQTVRKAILQWKRRLAAVAKQN